MEKPEKSALMSCLNLEGLSSREAIAIDATPMDLRYWVKS